MKDTTRYQVLLDGLVLQVPDGRGGGACAWGAVTSSWASPWLLTTRPHGAAPALTPELVADRLGVRAQAALRHVGPDPGLRVLVRAGQEDAPPECVLPRTLGVLTWPVVQGRVTCAVLQADGGKAPRPAPSPGLTAPRCRRVCTSCWSPG